MATTIIDTYPESSYTLTSRMDSIRALTDNSKVEVKVVCDPSGYNEEIFSTSLYSFNGMVELTDTGKLIEEHFRATGRIYDKVGIRFDEAELTVLALYCSYELPTGFDARSCFWTTASTSIVHRNSAITLTHHNAGAAMYHVRVTGFDAAGHTVVAEGDFSRNAGSGYVAFSVNDLLSFATGQGQSMAKVCYFTIGYGNCSKLYYVADDPFFMTFRFHNLFNASEYVDITGTVKRKTEVERDIAVCGGLKHQYDQTINRIYEVTTGALTSDQVLTIEQLVSSYEAALCAGTRDYEIIITDHTCETDNDDDNLTTMKFTFQLVNDRPMLFDSELGSLVPTDHRVFSEEFTAEFA